MDSELLDQTLAYHGPILMETLTEEHGEALHLPAALRRRYSGPDSTAAKDHCLQHGEKDDSELTAAVHKFIARKADMLFQRARRKSMGKETADANQPEDVFGIMPPLESFMGLPSDVCQDHFYENLRAGDLVVGVVSSVSDSGVIATLLCTDMPGLHRDIDELDINAFCPAKELPRMFAHQSLTEAYYARDIFRGIVLAVNPEKKRIFVSLRDKAATSIDNLPKIGLISKDDFPVHYRRKLERCGLSYSELLTSVLGFTNKGSVDVVQCMLGLTNSASLMRGLNGVKVPEEECAEALRKWQTDKQVHASVVMGVEMVKKGRQLEAIQHLNMALKIDPCHTEALVARGAVYANNASFHKAIEDFQKALDGNPKHVNAKKYLVETRIACARRCEDEGSVGEAMDHYRAVLRQVPQSMDARHGLDRCRRLQGKEQSTKGKNSSDSDSSSSSEEEGDNLQKSADKLMRLMKAEKKDGRKKRDSGHPSPGTSKKSRKKKKERRKSKQRSRSASSSSSFAPASPHAELNKMFEEWQSQQPSHQTKTYKGKKPPSSPSPSKRRASPKRSSSSGSRRKKQPRKRKSKSSSQNRIRSRSRSRSSSTLSCKPNAKTSFGGLLMDVFMGKSSVGSEGAASEGREKTGGGGVVSEGNKWDDLATYIGPSSRQRQEAVAELGPSRTQRSGSRSSDGHTSCPSSSSGGRRKKRQGGGGGSHREGGESGTSPGRRRSGSGEGRWSRKDRHRRQSRSSERHHKQSKESLAERWCRERRRSPSQSTSKGRKRHRKEGSLERRHHSAEKKKSKMKEGKDFKPASQARDLLTIFKDVQNENAGHKEESRRDGRKPSAKGDSKYTEDGNRSRESVWDGKADLAHTSDRAQARTKDPSALDSHSKERDLPTRSGGYRATEEKQKSCSDVSGSTDRESAAVIAKNGSLTVASKWDSPTRRSRWDLSGKEEDSTKHVLVKPVLAGQPVTPETALMDQGREDQHLPWKPLQKSGIHASSRWIRSDHVPEEATEPCDKPSAHDADGTTASTSRPASAWSKDKEGPSSRFSTRDERRRRSGEAQGKGTSKQWADGQTDSTWIELPPSKWSHPEADESRVAEKRVGGEGEEVAASERCKPGAGSKPPPPPDSTLIRELKDLVCSQWDEETVREWTKETAAHKQSADSTLIRELKDLVCSQWDEETVREWTKETAAHKQSAEGKDEAPLNRPTEEGNESSAKRDTDDSPGKPGDRDRRRSQPDRSQSARSRSPPERSRSPSERRGERGRDEAPSTTTTTTRPVKEEEEEEEERLDAGPQRVDLIPLPGADGDTDPPHRRPKGPPSLWPADHTPSDRPDQDTKGQRSGHQGHRPKDTEAQRSGNQGHRPKYTEGQRSGHQGYRLKDTEAQRSGNQGHRPMGGAVPSKMRKDEEENRTATLTLPAQAVGLGSRPSHKLPGEGAQRDSQQQQERGEVGVVGRSVGGAQGGGGGGGGGEGGGDKMREVRELMLQHLMLQRLELQDVSLQDLEQRLCQEIASHLSTTTPSTTTPSSTPPQHSGQAREGGWRSETKSRKEDRGEGRERVLERDQGGGYPAKPDQPRRKGSSGEAGADLPKSDCSDHSGKWEKEEEVGRVSPRRRGRSADVSPDRKTERREKGGGGCGSREGRESRRRSGEGEKLTVQKFSHRSKDSSTWMEKIISNVDLKPSSKALPGDVDIRFLFTTSAGTVDSSFSHQLVPDTQASCSSRKRRKSSSSSSERESGRNKRERSGYQRLDAEDRSKKKKRRRSSSSSSSSSTDEKRKEKRRSSTQKKKRHRSSSSQSSSDDRHGSRKRSSHRKNRSKSSSSSTSRDRRRQKKKSGSSAQKGKYSKRHRSSSSSSSSSSPQRKDQRISPRGNASAGPKHGIEDYRRAKPGLSSQPAADVYSAATKLEPGPAEEPTVPKLNELEDFLKELKTKRKEKMAAEGKGKKV